MIAECSQVPRVPLRISSYENLQMAVYVLGCPCQGEMIVTVLLDGDEVKYSILTDCYLRSIRHANVFARWCKKIGVSHFDTIIFTHPDVDHCMGVDYLVRLMDPSYSSLLFIHSQMYAVVKISEDQILRPFREIWSGYKKNGTLHLQSKTQIRSKIMLEIEFNSMLHESSLMQLVQLAPDDLYLADHNLYRKNGSSHNDLSLVYSIYYNNKNYLYCADMPGDGVKYIDENYLYNVRFVKIPHHGSPDCIALPAMLFGCTSAGITSVTTIYHKLADEYKLPQDQILKLYRKKGRVYCTGPHIHSAPSKLYKYGGVRLSWSLFDDSVAAEWGGNAYEYVNSI